MMSSSESSNKKKVLKRSKTGIETEFHVMDNSGRISNKADVIIDKLKTNHGDISVTKEMAKNIIEFNAYPSIETHNTVLDVISIIKKAEEYTEKEELVLYPFGTYPGKFTPDFNTGAHYERKEKIFGEERKKILGRCAGFHHHYTLPKGVFDKETKELKFLKRSKLERSMMSSYNFEIAIDPILTLFNQSSPFYEGFNLAKDSRIVVYRGGTKLNYKQGAYGNLQQIGGLPPYKQTLTDLFSSLKKRRLKWKKLIHKVDPETDFDELYKYKLDIGWHPVKINKHGTLEQRGMDMNYISTLAATTLLIKFCLKEIQREFIEVIPADFAMEEPFKREGKILYIPPHTHVRNKLQKHSAYKGYQSKDMALYTKRLLTFAKSVMPKKHLNIIKPLINMSENKESVSDRILKYAKKKNYYYDNGKINNIDAAELALHFSSKFRKDMEDTEKKLEKISNL